MKKRQAKGRNKEQIAAIISAVIIVVFLGGSIFIGLVGSGIAGGAKSKVSDKELEQATVLSNGDSEEVIVSVKAIENDIVVTKNGTSEKAASGKGDAGSEVSDSDYIFPNSDTKRLTDDEVSGKSKAELRIGRNEIMARHGRIFDSEDLKEHFESKSWYNGTVSPEEFDKNMDSRLNEVERANIEMIKKYE